MIDFRKVTNKQTHWQTQSERAEHVSRSKP